MLVSLVAIVITCLTMLACAAIHSIKLNLRGDSLTLDQHAFYAIAAFAGSMVVGIMTLGIQLVMMTFSS